MKKNIIVEISEGLGNQMFMYAHAYALASEYAYSNTNNLITMK